MHRSFVALDLTEPMRRRLAAVARSIRSHDPRWATARWVPPENLHLTIRFLGDLAEENLESFIRDLPGAVGALSTFELPLAEVVRPIPSSSHASMLWATFDDPDGRCALLANAVSDLAATLGVAPETRPFSPHVTLARSRRPIPFSADVTGRADGGMYTPATGPPDSMSVREVTVYTSTLARAGARYRRWASIELGER